METKTCSKCHKINPIFKFGKDKRNKDGHKSYCKRCEKGYCKKYYLNNIEKLKNRSKKYYENNKIKIQKQHNKYQQSHKQELKEYLKNYYQNNKKKIKKQRNKQTKEKRKKDPIYRMINSIRSRIYSALKRNAKSVMTRSLVGCDFEYLAYHLQCQFKKGMTWDNYSLYGWHIDHIKPVASFDLSKPKEQRKAFHYTNLQPLWAEENYSKGNKRIMK